MWLLILEAAAAFFLLAFIVWWTMFSGRIQDNDTDAEPEPDHEPEPMPTAGMATGMESAPVAPAASAVAKTSPVTPPQP